VHTNSPLPSGTYPMRPDHPEVDNPDRVEGTLVEARNYGLLEELNTRPRTTYLTKVGSPNPEIEDA